MSLTQYLEFQEDQDMIGLFNFLEFKRREEKRREGVFVCLGMKEKDGVYIVVVEEYEWKTI